MITNPSDTPLARLRALSLYFLDAEVNVDALVLSQRAVAEMRTVCEEAVAHATCVNCGTIDLWDAHCDDCYRRELEKASDEAERDARLAPTCPGCGCAVKITICDTCLPA